MMLISSKDARPMSAPTTRAMYANDKQHGTRKRKNNKTTTKHFKPNMNREKHGFAKLCLVVTGERSCTKHNPWDAKLWDTPQNVGIVGLR